MSYEEEDTCVSYEEEDTCVQRLDFRRFNNHHLDNIDGSKCWFKEWVHGWV